MKKIKVSEEFIEMIGYLIQLVTDLPESHQHIFNIDNGYERWADFKDEYFSL